MIEINKRAKPQPPKNPVPLTNGLHYKLRNGMLMQVAGGIVSAGGMMPGIITKVPAGFVESMKTNPAFMTTGTMGHWNNQHGRYVGYEAVEDMPYHVIHSVEAPDVVPVPPAQLHVNESADVLWAWFSIGGDLEYALPPPKATVWQGYYVGPNRASLTKNIVNWHVDLYWLRRKQA